MTDDEQLFGHDMRHHPPLRIMPTARFAYEHITDNRQYDGIRRQRMKELDKFIVLFDAPGIIGGDYMFMSNCWRYVIPTWDYGRIEVDVFKENYLLLPEQKHRIHICNRLNTAGYSFQIIGELKFINIKRLRAKKSRKSRYRHCPTDMRCTLTANGITGICIST